MKSQKREIQKTSQSVGRPREFDESDVLGRVMKLFWTQGYEGTGMSDILSATGLTKGSIYKAFESKHKLYLKSLEHYEATHVDTAVAALTASKPAKARLDDFLSAPIKNYSSGKINKGCFLCNASADRADIDEATCLLVQRGFKKLGRALTVVLSELHPDWTTERQQQAAQMALSVYSGLRIMSRSGLDITALKNAKNGALELIT